MKEAWKRMKARVVMAIAVLGVATGAMGNLLTNPGFEAGDSSGWVLFSESQNWRVTDWPGDQHSGTYGMVNDVLASGGDEWRGIYQMVSVVAGQNYDYFAYQRAAGVESDMSESFLELQWLNSSGGMIDQWQAAHVTVDQDWTLMGANNIMAPVGAVTASVRFIVHAMGTPADTDWHIADDFTFAASIPEPTTAMLVGLGAFSFAVCGSRIRRGLKG